MKSIYSEEKWANLQEKKEGGVLTTYVYENKYGKVIYRFITKVAGIINDITYYDIASYRGAQGPYIECDNINSAKILIDEFIVDFTKYCNEKKVIAEFSKLDPWQKYAELIVEKCNAEYYGNYYCNDLTIDFYHNEYNRRSKRSIKKAIDSGVTVKFDFEGKTIQQFLDLYKNTEDKFNTSEYYIFTEEDIIEYFTTFPGRCFFSNAYWNGEIITSVLSVLGEDIVHYLYLGTNPKFLEYQANSLLTYETARLGKRMNRKIFDMGGGSPGGNIEQFKRNFIRESGVVKYYTVRKIYNRQIYNWLVEKRGSIKNEKFFPLYRG